jgi:hypothetical protein
MNVLEYQAEQIVRSAKMVAYWVETTDPTRLAWEPKAEAESSTRSILDQLGECIGVNYMMAAALKEEGPGSPDGGDRPAPVDGAQACRELVTSAEALASVVRDLGEDALTKTYTLPWGSMPGSFLVSMPASNMVYHGGQINYVQRLYGDTVFHFPGTESAGDAPS